MSEWICESCIYYPPSSCDGKLCCICDTDDPMLNCYSKREDDNIMEETESRKFIREEVMKQMD